MLYLPCQTPNQDLQAVKNIGFPTETAKTDRKMTKKGTENWAKVIAWWSKHYGTLVSGWWFDGGYQHCQFDSKIAKIYAEAAKSGNKNAIVTFNPGVKLERATTAEDYTAGEINEPLKEIISDRWIDGSQAHGSRYMVNNRPFDYVLEKMNLADKQNALTPYGKETLKKVKVAFQDAYDRGGDLSKLGGRQHQGIAKRMYQNFPEVLAQPIKVDAHEQPRAAKQLLRIGDKKYLRQHRTDGIGEETDGSVFNEQRMNATFDSTYQLQNIKDELSSGSIKTQRVNRHTTAQSHIGKSGIAQLRFFRFANVDPFDCFARITPFRGRTIHEMLS